MKILGILAGVAGLVVFVGCSRTDNEPNLQSVLKDDIQKASVGLVELSAFDITNGQTANVHGVDVRSLEFEAVATLKAPAVLVGGFAKPYAAREPKSPAELAAIEAERQKARSNRDGGFLASVIPEYKETVSAPGTEILLHGTAVFEMKDNGWDLVTFEVFRRKGGK